MAFVYYAQSTITVISGLDWVMHWLDWGTLSDISEKLLLQMWLIVKRTCFGGSKVIPCTFFPWCSFCFVLCSAWGLLLNWHESVSVSVTCAQISLGWTARPKDMHWYISVAGQPTVLETSSVMLILSCSHSGRKKSEKRQAIQTHEAIDYTPLKDLGIAYAPENINHCQIFILKPLWW